jgi:hypothetical protein
VLEPFEMLGKIVDILEERMHEIYDRFFVGRAVDIAGCFPVIRDGLYESLEGDLRLFHAAGDKKSRREEQGGEAQRADSFHGSDLLADELISYYHKHAVKYTPNL